MLCERETERHACRCYFQFRRDPREELRDLGLGWVRSADALAADPSAPSPTTGDFRACGLDRAKEVEEEEELKVRLDGECGCSWRRSLSMSPWVCFSAGLSGKVWDNLLLQQRQIVINTSISKRNHSHVHIHLSQHIYKHFLKHVPAAAGSQSRPYSRFRNYGLRVSRDR